MDNYTNKILNIILDELILEIENKNKDDNYCKHKWIYDLIDINPNKSINICYCCKCELTK
jgi:hypothetical protein